MLSLIFLYSCFSSGWDLTRVILPAESSEKANRSQWPACTIFKNENPASLQSFCTVFVCILNKHPEVPRILTIACLSMNGPRDIICCRIIALDMVCLMRSEKHWVKK